MPCSIDILMLYFAVPSSRRFFHRRCHRRLHRERGLGSVISAGSDRGRLNFHQYISQLDRVRRSNEVMIEQGPRRDTVKEKKKIRSLYY